MWISLPQRWTSRVVLLVLIGALLIMLIAPKATAQYSNTDVRISRLESEVSQLRSRISQVERGVGRTGQTTRVPSRSPEEVTTGPISSDPMFDRLATLVIELRERIDVLEAQVAELQGN